MNSTSRGCRLVSMRGEVARPGDDRTASHAEAYAEFGRQDLCQGRLAETWRAGEQDMVERVSPGLAASMNTSRLARLGLADEFCEPPGPEAERRCPRSPASGSIARSRASSFRPSRSSCVDGAVRRLAVQHAGKGRVCFSAAIAQVQQGRERIARRQVRRHAGGGRNRPAAAAFTERGPSVRHAIRAASLAHAGGAGQHALSPRRDRRRARPGQHAQERQRHPGTYPLDRLQRRNQFRSAGSAKAEEGDRVFAHLQSRCAVRRSRPPAGQPLAAVAGAGHEIADTGHVEIAWSSPIPARTRAGGRSQSRPRHAGPGPRSAPVRRGMRMADRHRQRVGGVGHDLAGIPAAGCGPSWPPAPWRRCRCRSPLV